MKLSDIPITELRRSLKAISKAFGPQAQEVQILRRELARRRKRPPVKATKNTVLSGRPDHA